jgi:hypothetical protein
MSLLGRTTWHRLSPEIASEDFRKALVDAIIQSRLFNAVTADRPDFNLMVTLIKTVPPSGFFAAATSTVEAQWQLTRLVDNKLLADEYIITPGHAGPFDALQGVERIRMANEGAARANITEGLRRLADLPMEQSRK